MSCPPSVAFSQCTVGELLSSVPGLEPVDASLEYMGMPVKELVTDSRQVSTGDVFLAIKSAHGDGLRYIEHALAQGAACCLVDDMLLGDLDKIGSITWKRVIAVSGLSRYLSRLAVAYYNDPSAKLPVIGITGTNGKSSCVHFLAQMAGNIWDQPGAMLGTLGWGLVEQLHNATHTTPDCISLQRSLARLVAQSVSLAAIEVSSHALIQQRTKGTRFAIAAFTNLSQDHLDYHGDMAAYLKAKLRLFTDHPIGAAVIGIDDQYGVELAATVKKVMPATVQVLTTSAAGKQADITVMLDQASKKGPAGLQISISSPWGCADVQTGLLGGFNAANLATCIACLGSLRVPFGQMLNALEKLQPVPGRMQCVPGQTQQPLVIVDYAHTPDALDNALRSCRRHTQSDLWCVFGCGGERDRGKRAQMGSIAERLSDRIIITSDNPREEQPETILNDIREGFQHPEQVQLEVDRESAIRQAITGAHQGDCILIAGKGHEQTQQIGDRRLPFDDVSVAAQILEQLAC